MVIFLSIVFGWRLGMRMVAEVIRRGLRRGDKSVVHFHDPVGVVKNARVVRDDYDTAVRVAGGFAQQIQGALAGGGVERGGGFVADDQPRLVDHGPRDGHTLLLSAGHL